jgi:PST family polysaccharide transporter
MINLLLSHIFPERASVRAALLNSIWLLLDKCIRLVGGLFIGVWVARYLAPENFGLMNTLLAIYGLVVVLCGLSFEPVILRFLAKYPSKEAVVLGTALRLRLMVAIIAGIGFMCMPLFWSGAGVSPWLWVIMASSFFLNPFLIVRQWFESRVLSKYVVIAELMAFVVSSVLKIVGILFHFSVSWFVIVIVLEAFLGLLGYGIFYLRQRQSGSWCFSWRMARVLLRQSWPLLLSTAAILIYMRIDQVMVLSLAGRHDAGVYAAAARVSEILYFLPSIVLSSVFPGLTVLRKTNIAKYRDQLSLLFSGVSLMSYGISLLIVLFSPLLIAGLYGTLYLGAAPILVVHVLSFVWVAMGVISSIFTLNEKLTRHTMVRDCIAAGLNVAFNFCLIPYWGAMGAAVATFVAYSFSGFWGNFFFSKLRPLFYLQLRGLKLEGLGRGLLKLKEKL